MPTLIVDPFSFSLSLFFHIFILFFNMVANEFIFYQNKVDLCLYINVISSDIFDINQKNYQNSIFFGEILCSKYQIYLGVFFLTIHCLTISRYAKLLKYWIQKAYFDSVKWWNFFEKLVKSYFYQSICINETGECSKRNVVSQHAPNHIQNWHNMYNKLTFSL